MLFAEACLGPAASGATDELIAARAAMGIAAALIYPAMPAHLTAVFTDCHEKATAVGIWSGICGLAVALGPAAGGVLLRHYSWSSIFVVNIPLAVLALVAGLSLVSETQDPYPCGITAIYFAHYI
ncbi:MFS transporter [Mycobacterium malmoense]|uniref:MFS transporter n=1 Tax=Mycobacterium malmoense TaxID=1780 RepID=UPI0009F29AAE|nr:MFS transporter [Mycobacterium malmoense]